MIIVIINVGAVSVMLPLGTWVCNLTLYLPGQSVLFLLSECIRLVIQHAAWKRSQVVLISGKRAGIIKGFGWPYDSVRCWLVWQLTFVVGGFSYAMGSRRGILCFAVHPSCRSLEGRCLIKIFTIPAKTFLLTPKPAEMRRNVYLMLRSIGSRYHAF